MSTTLIAPAQLDEIVAIDNTCRDAQRQIASAEASGNQTTKAFLIARATRVLQSLLTEAMMADIMALQSSPLGFRTDRDHVKDSTQKKGYPVEVVRDVAIQALMRGFQLTGNQINIIGGNLYVTREGFEHRLKHFEGLTNLELSFEVPDMSRGNALVSCLAKWVFHGVPMELKCQKTTQGDFRIPVRVNAGMGDDAILGKAKSKLLRKIYERVSGWTVDGVDDAGVVDADSVETVEQITEPTATEAEASAVELAAVEAAYMPDALEFDFQEALGAARTKEHFRAVWNEWTQKAKNRGLSKEQTEYMQARIKDAAESAAVAQA